MTRSRRIYRRRLVRVVLLLAFAVALTAFWVTPSLELLMMSLATLGALLSEIAIGFYHH